jgi:hypothetical protein
VSAIDLEGRLPDGSSRRFTIALETSSNDALPLLWAREHIAELELRHDRDQAVRTSQLFNLLCSGTAFIAWDEAENVKIAEEEIYQPSMAVALESRTLRCLAKAMPVAGGWSQDLGAFAPSDDNLSDDVHGVCDAAPPSGPSDRRVFKVERRTRAPIEAQLIKLGIDPKVAEILAKWTGLDHTLRRNRPRLLKALIATLEAYPASPGDLLTLCGTFIEAHLTHSPEYPAAKAAMTAWAARCSPETAAKSKAQ